MQHNTIQHPDFGTKTSHSSQKVSLTINGQTVTVPQGTSIMRAAEEAGINVPKLCATDSVEAFGSCRMCVVQVDGIAKPQASCHTPVRPDMVVHTETERLFQLRKGLMQLYISEHPLDCLICPTNGDCQLQDMAAYAGIREIPYSTNTITPKPIDTSNPYFQFDPEKCIVCTRCVRACSEVQGTFALTLEGRGLNTRITTAGDDFMSSECVSCGACVSACPTASLVEKNVRDKGLPEEVIKTTCAYCGVGCSFDAQVRGEEVIRMIPSKEGGANTGHSCVKGRFAWEYATHEDRITQPMIRDSITEEWRSVSWEGAFTFAAQKFLDIKAKKGAKAIGGITSSRCTNEETFLVQKLIRAAIGSNNVDTCARVCHSPTGYGLKQTFGTSAGTQNFESVGESDVLLFIGANPTDAHPVFASRVKRRLRQGAKLIVVDPRHIDLLDAKHTSGENIHLALKPGTNVALLNALAHEIVKNNWYKADYIQAQCDSSSFKEWLAFIQNPEHDADHTEAITGVPAKTIRAAAHCYATGGNAAIYYGLGVTEHEQGSSAVMAIANLAMLTGNIGRPGVGVNPLRGQNNVQGACDMGSFPHELPGYRHISDDTTRVLYEELWKTPIDNEPGMRIPNMFDAALDNRFSGIYIQGEDPVQSEPNTQHVIKALEHMECVIVQDLFLNETSRYAHVFFPGTSFLEKDGTFTNAERRINRIRKIKTPLSGYADWEITVHFARYLGYVMEYDHPSQIMDEIAKTTPTFAGMSYEKLDQHSIQWPCNDKAPLGTPVMHTEQFTNGAGQFIMTPFVASQEKNNRNFPLILTTGRILSQYNVGTQTNRSKNRLWHQEDVLDIHVEDAKARDIKTGDTVYLRSHLGSIPIKAHVSDKVVPGVVYTTFHHPLIKTNIVTSAFSDWATNCPEYKVTAVEVTKEKIDIKETLAFGGEASKLAFMAEHILAQFKMDKKSIKEQKLKRHFESFWTKDMQGRLKDFYASNPQSCHPLIERTLIEIDA